MELLIAGLIVVAVLYYAFFMGPKEQTRAIWEDDPAPAPMPEPEPSPEPSMPTPEVIDFGRMTKVQIEEWARTELGLELDRRKTKANMIAEVKEKL